MDSQLLTNSDIEQILSTNKGGNQKECRIETLVSEPQVCNDQICVFNINRGGILDKSSRIKIPAFRTTANELLPPISGV